MTQGSPDQLHDKMTGKTRVETERFCAIVFRVAAPYETMDGYKFTPAQLTEFSDALQAALREALQ